MRTIQFPFGMSGKSGFGPFDVAGHMQIAVPIPIVSVGETKIRRKLLLELVPSTHPAPIFVEAVDCQTKAVGNCETASHHAVATFDELHGSDASSESGETGHIIGIVTHQGLTPISRRVSAENIGIP